MLKRKVYSLLMDSLKKDKISLFIEGSRQVGKTYILKYFQTNNFKYNFYVNVLTDINAYNLLRKSKNADDFYLRLSYLYPNIGKDSSSIFIDEIQAFYDKDNPNKDSEDKRTFDIITISKELVIRYPDRFMFSGSLLGTIANDVLSWPMGYCLSIRMYPLDFEEFCWALNINQNLIDKVKKDFINKTPVEDFLNDEFINLFNKYCLIGGMPDAVKEYAENHNLKNVEIAHKKIDSFISKDIAKYAPQNEKIHIKEIYKLIPSELNSKNKRFCLKNVKSAYVGKNLTTPFKWIKTAGVSIPVYNITEPTIPLILSSKRTLMKVFHEDVGLLTYLMLSAENKLKLLDEELKINFGSIYENAVAELLQTNGFEDIYYYDSKKYGEIDFVVEKNGYVLLIEIKFGKDYSIHHGLNNILEIKQYNIKEGYVFGNCNVFKKGNIQYFPIYMISFLEKKN